MRIVVIGTGSIGMRHHRLLSELPDLEVVAMPVRASRREELLGEGACVVSSLEEAGVVDGVVVATDTSRHVADTLDALERGARAVLVEKPLAATAGDLDPLRDMILSEHAGIFVGCCLRFEPSLRLFRENLPAIGRAYQVSIEARSHLPDWRPDRDYRTSYSARTEEGGVLRDLIHEIDYALWLFGRPAELTGRVARSGLIEIESEDQANASWVSGSGVYVTVALDYLSRVPVRRMTAFGTGGVLEWNGIERATRLDLPGESRTTFAPATDRDNMFRAQRDRFLAAMRGESPGDLATGREGADALAVCDAIRRSSNSGRTEEVIYWRRD